MHHISNLRTKPPPPPDYRPNLSHVFGEEFLAEATLKDKNLQTVIRFVNAHIWEELKQFSMYYCSLAYATTLP